MGAHLSRTIAEGRAFIQLVGGRPVDSLSGKRIDGICPSNGKVFASIPAAGVGMWTLRCALHAMRHRRRIELPFGGFMKSGHGREKGFEALST